MSESAADRLCPDRGLIAYAYVNKNEHIFFMWNCITEFVLTGQPIVEMDFATTDIAGKKMLAYMVMSFIFSANKAICEIRKTAR